MKNGEFPDGSRTLRAKIDMAHTNMLMRDPCCTVSSMHIITKQGINGVFTRCMILHMAKVIALNR